jgi:hypothetical protein
MSHHIKKCMHCGTVMGQCRCPAPDKTVIWEECSKCTKNIAAGNAHPHNLAQNKAAAAAKEEEPEYAMKPDDYSWVTQEMFAKKLDEIFSGMTHDEILGTPGVQEIFSEELNNDVLIALENEKK